MSYSRFSTSIWYTYWSSLSGDTKESQVFEICPTHRFTYKELKEDMEGCLSVVKSSENYVGNDYYSDETVYDELEIYMKRFVADVDEDFGYE